MTIHPTPLHSTLDLTSPESLTTWMTEPPTLRGLEKVEFWNRMPPLTVAQYLALRLGRLPHQASLGAIASVYSRWYNDPRRDFASVPLRRYRRIWARSHESLLFRFDPRRVGRRLDPMNPLHQIAGWISAEQEIESRYLMEGFPQPMPWQVRQHHLRESLKSGIRAGYILGAQRARVPAAAWMPSRDWCTANGIPPRRIKESAVEHGQLAVEFALARLALQHSISAAHTFRSEAEVISEARRGHGRIQRGQRLSVTADLEVETPNQSRYWYEVISEWYRNDDVTAKYAGISHPVEFVATSRTVAKRVQTAAPRAVCYYF